MILVDINVVLDVMQSRQPHFRASSQLLDLVVGRQVEACFAAHGITTVHYLVGRYRDGRVANAAVDWLLRYFQIVPIGRDQLLRARSLGWDDFEDAVIAAAAESAACSTLVTRNVKDFPSSPVQVLTPGEYLATILE